MTITDLDPVSVAHNDDPSRLDELIAPFCSHCGKRLGKVFVYLATLRQINKKRSGLGYHPDCAVEVGQSLMDTGLGID